MAKKDSNIPTKLEVQSSFLDLIRKILNRTTKSIDKKGRIRYISYPSKKGFTEKQKADIEELEINDVSIVGETRDMSLEGLKNLKRLALGRDVIAVTEGTIPKYSLNTLELSNTVKQIPPNVITDSSIKKVKGNDFCIATNSENTRTDIYIDTDERLHFIETGNFSLDQSGYEEDINSSVSIESYVMAKNILEASSNFENENTVYIFDEGKFGTRRYVVHAVVDEFPMPENREKKFADDKLVGVLINGKEEVNLEYLRKYPNLLNIYIGKDAKKILGIEFFKDTNIIKMVKQKNQEDMNDSEKSVNMYQKILLLKRIKKSAPNVGEAKE